MKQFLKFVFICLLSFVYVGSIYAVDMAPNAKSAFLMEVSSENVLFSKNEDEKLFPASMTKMMSLYLVMEAIQNGKLSLEDEVVISEHASSMGGSQIWLKPQEVMKVDALLRSVAIASANDAIVALAEQIAISEENFVKLMNDKVQEWGLVNTHFENVSGLHSDSHYSSAKDMAMIGKYLLEIGGDLLLSYTSLYDSYIRQGTDAEVWLVNTNKLLRTFDGTDGLKTGYTSQSGYCITLTTKKNGLRLIGVVMKEPTNKVRDNEIRKLMEYGFSMYDSTVVFPVDSNVAEFVDAHGKPSESSLYVNEDVVLHYLKGNENKNIESNLKINDYTLPLRSGAEMGVMEFISVDGVKTTVPIFLRDSIEKLGYFDYFKMSLKELLF